MDSMIDCGTVRGEIYLYLERELPEDQLRGIAGHLDSCQRCREYQSRVVEFQKSLPSWTVPDGSESFVEGVLARVAQHERGQRRTIRLRSLVWGVRGFLHSTLRLPLPVGIAAAALLVGSISLNLALVNRQQPPSKPFPDQTGDSEARDDRAFPPPVAHQDRPAPGDVLGPPGLSLVQPDFQRIAEPLRSRSGRPEKDN